MISNILIVNVLDGCLAIGQISASFFYEKTPKKICWDVVVCLTEEVKNKG